MRCRAWGARRLYPRALETQRARNRDAEGAGRTIRGIFGERCAQAASRLYGHLRFCPPTETGNFVNTLFTSLRTKSYLPYSATSPSSGFPPSDGQTVDTGIPIPLDALMSPTGPTSPERGRKRSLEGDDRDSRPPAKGPRLDRDGQFSRYGRNDGHRSSWGGNAARMGLSGRGDYMDGGVGMGNGPMGAQNGHPRYQPPGVQRGICRDYFSELRASRCQASFAKIEQIMGIVLAAPSASIAMVKMRSCPHSCSP